MVREDSQDKAVIGTVFVNTTMCLQQVSQSDLSPQTPLTSPQLSFLEAKPVKY